MNISLKKKLISFILGILVPFSYNSNAQISNQEIRIGFSTDLSGLYSDLDGPGAVEAVKMAIADFGGNLNGKKIDLQILNHQNKPEIASVKAREWADSNFDLLLGGVNSGVALAISKIAAEKKVAFISVGGGTARLTNEECTPYTINYVLDTIAQARVVGKAVTSKVGKTWYFLVADYAFGHSLEKDTSEVVLAGGGKVEGSIRHPVGSSDFSSYLLRAQSSKASILAFANAGSDLHNSVKAATEFGIDKSMKMTAMMQFITDTHTLGLPATQGMFLSDAWYWDLNEETRAWSRRFFEKMKKMPTVLQAGAYSATYQYLTAVKKIGTDDSAKVIAHMKTIKINDFFAKNGYIRPDGRMVHEYYLMEVKKPSESKYPWDYYKVIERVPGEDAFNTKAESKCNLWK
jgi:branched-chain amino acid transport system substrate-binding protein